MAYNKINWQNGPDGGTALSARNLDAMDSAIAVHDSTLSTMQTTVTNLSNMVTTVSQKADAALTTATVASAEVAKRPIVTDHHANLLKS